MIWLSLIKHICLKAIPAWNPGDDDGIYFEWTGQLTGSISVNLDHQSGIQMTTQREAWEWKIDDFLLDEFCWLILRLRQKQILCFVSITFL